MDNASLVGLSRQIALSRELDVIANNVANIGTAGFKARQLRFDEFLSPKASADAFARADRRVSFVVDRGATLDLQAGAIERTGNPLDVAVRGDALLVVRTPQGERYTRNGAFEINARGELATSDGDVVLGESGPIAFSPAERGIAVAADGTVSSNEGARGKLRLVAVPDAGRLRNEGANLFSSGTPLAPAREGVRVESGAIERSNVKPIAEMSRLVEVNRSYSAVAAMIGREDELRRNAIERLAAVPA